MAPNDELDPADLEDRELYALSARYQEALADHRPLPSLAQLAPTARRRFERLCGLMHALQHVKDQATLPVSAAPAPGVREGEASAEPDLQARQEPRPPPGTGVLSGQLGHYQLLRERGRGGMGVVYEARDLVLDRPVAVKMIHPGRAGDGKWRSRFLAEGKMLGRQHHPNIVQVYEISENDGLPYLVLEYVDGPTLQARLAEGPIDPRQAATLVETLARAVEHAHGNGILHRDLKPANILLARSTGIPKISDFGLAALLDHSTALTQTGEVLGTPAYMAPEMTLGDRLESGLAVDVYGLGVILYEALTGRAPFVGLNVLLVLALVRSVDPLAPRQLQPGVPRDLETICLKCLHKEPRRRYPSAQALADDLRRFLDGHPIQARPARWPERAVRWARRRPALALAWGLALVALTAAVGMSAGYYVTLTEERDYARYQEAAAKQARNETERLRGEADRARRQAEDRLFDLQTAAGLSAGRDNDPALAALWFALAARQAGTSAPEQAEVSRLRWRAYTAVSAVPRRAAHLPAGHDPQHLALYPAGRWLIAASAPGWLMWDLVHDQAVPWPGPQRNVTAALWSPNGKLLATGSDTGTVHLFTFPQGNLLRHWQLAHAVTALTFDVNGRRLAMIDGRVHVWDVQQSQFLFPDPLPPERVVSAAFAPSGARLSTVSADNTAWVFDLGEDGDSQVLLGPVPTSPGPHVRKLHAPGFLGDDRLLSSTGKEVELWDLEARAVQLRMPGDEVGWSLGHASPNGRFFVLSHHTRNSELRQADSPQRTDLILPSRDIYKPVFSPDGAHFAMSIFDGVAFGSMDRNPPGGVLPLRGGPWPAACAPNLCGSPGDATPGGRAWLATACQQGLVQVWQVGAASPLVGRLPIPDGDNKTFFQLSPDRHWVLTAQRDHDRFLLQVHSIGDGKPTGPIWPVLGIPQGAAFSPDGQTVYVVCPGGAGGALHAWRRTGAPAFPVVTLPYAPLDVACSPDGRTLVVTGSEGDVELRAATDGERRGGGKHASGGWALFPGKRIQFNRDGRTFVTYGAGKQVLHWDCAAGRVLRSLCVARHCLNADHSPDGRLLATGCASGQVAVWDLARGVLAAPPLDHPNRVYTVRFDPAGERVVTACKDGFVRIWDWRTGRQLVPAMNHGMEVPDAAFSADGRWVATAASGFARIWEARTGVPLTPAWRLLLPGQAPPWFPTRLAFAGDHRLLVAFRGSHVALFDVSLLTGPVAADLSADDLVLLAEINAGTRVLPDGSTERLSSAEWFERWQTYRRRHPPGSNEDLPRPQ